MSARSAKATIRRDVIARILAMDPADRQSQELTLLQQFLMLQGFEAAQSVLLYASAFAEEFATIPMLRASLDMGKRLLLPRVDREANLLRLFEVMDPDVDLIPSRKGIPEPSLDAREVRPEEVDWILVPGLAFDRSGFRIGRGAGHYDRLLPKLRPEVSRWALILTPQWVDRLPVEPHDQPVDGIADFGTIWNVAPGRFTR